MTIVVRFAVCDSEQGTVDYIINKLSAYYPGECNITAYLDSEDMLLDHHKEHFDAIFLLGLNGMEIAEKIRENDRRVIIILVSGQDELAYKGYYYDAFRFVRKSNLDEDLHEAARSLNRALRFQNEHLEFKTDNGEVSRTVKDIKYFEADGHFIKMTCTEEIIRVHGTMKEYEARLKDIGFIRIHKGYLVNFRFISSVDNKFVTLTCGTRLPLSRKRNNDTIKTHDCQVQLFETMSVNCG